MFCGDFADFTGFLRRLFHVCLFAGKVLVVGLFRIREKGSVAAMFGTCVDLCVPRLPGAQGVVLRLWRARAAMFVASPVVLRGSNPNRQWLTIVVERFHPAFRSRISAVASRKHEAALRDDPAAIRVEEGRKSKGRGAAPLAHY